MDADIVFAELQAIIERALGERSGTFKVASVDSEVSHARQVARSMLDGEQRSVVNDAVARFRTWVIERDPEAFERVASGGHAPQDIEVAVRAAEDCAIALVLADLGPDMASALRIRLEGVTVETVEERTLAARPQLKWGDGNVRLMAAGLGVVFGGALVSAAFGASFFAVSALGAAVFVAGFRRWRSGELTSNVPPSHVLRGGTMGRNRSRNL
jgi:hypothetical protein